VQLAGLAVPLASTSAATLFASTAIVGAASGATTVLRPLLVVDIVGAGPYAAVSAHLQRATTIARAGAPLAIGAGAALVGWPATWTIALAAFAVAVERYLRLGRRLLTGTPPTAEGSDLRPGDVSDV
jgi:hypothetical protein